MKRIFIFLLFLLFFVTVVSPNIMQANTLDTRERLYYDNNDTSSWIPYWSTDGYVQVRIYEPNNTSSVRSTQNNIWDKYVPYQPYSTWLHLNPYPFQPHILDDVARAIRDESALETVARNFNGNPEYIASHGTRNELLFPVFQNSLTFIGNKFYIREVARQSGAYVVYDSDNSIAHVYTSEYPRAEFIEPVGQAFEPGESFTPQFRAEAYALINNNPTGSFDFGDNSQYTFELKHIYHENGVKREEVIATNETISPGTQRLHRNWNQPVQAPSVELKDGSNIFELEVTDAVERSVDTKPMIINTSTPTGDPNVCDGRIVTSVTAISGTYSCPPCDESGCATCYYYETLSIDVDSDEEVVKAGQGAEITANTQYTNENPAHRNRSYAPSKAVATGDMTDYYPNVYRESVDMLTEINNPSTYWGGGRTVEWELPYAKIHKDGTWEMTDDEEDAMNFVEADEFHYGGFQRWYTGFDLPDNYPVYVDVEADGGYNDLRVCDVREITIDGSPYDDFVIRTVDPTNPFPTGTGLNWQGHEEMITGLEEWYHAGDWRYQQRKEEAKEQVPTFRERIRQIFGFIWGD